ncbi:uncharacterized protein TRIADDRAFT_24455 [Trichoplax adhaerens]|uniref:26S proteasome non-ATPase regulatory subunit 9 n=1 Tax=Trichoplax adhaerens TaxID=10228 RepID=B3RTW1_TRIAD|nr:hypothetical protein TRIADDRAFT_24455 [Trichoplax adhaerens]EDV26206.1 hypothetical protein TRIADDRAFT_24455 [Trichoplax adhaerens]|eukprot:XP_002112239.1 hypothetical protein TRIADDRAFT_24455 [Trichoplax adhaerens]
MATEKVFDLMKKKEAIEAEIDQWSDVLQSQRNVGMNEPLVDSQGYPRADIDVYTVRKARQRIICLQNDHKAAMKEIESGLHQIHADARNSTLEKPSEDTVNEIDQAIISFAITDFVADGSPAAEAGLEKGDEICCFGTVNAENFRSLQDVGYIVKHSEQKEVKVIIRRMQKLLKLTITPRVWSGRGLLG